MSQETYSIPTGPAEQLDYVRNAVTLCTTNATAWGVPAAKLTAIVSPRTFYEQKSAIANNSQTQSPAATAGRTAAWVVLEPFITDLYDHHIINNAAISAADKEALHIHYAFTGGGAPSSAPASTPVVTLTSKEISMLRVVYSDSTTPSSHAKPKNVAFCELIYKIGDPAPVSIADCNVHINVSRSSEKVVFPPELRGKAIRGYARWVNKNGKTGPWSNQIGTIIP